MTKEELDFIGSMNMCDEISNEAYEKIVCHVEETEISDDCVSRQAVRDAIMKCETMNEDSVDGFIESTTELEAEIACLPPVTPTQCIAKVKFSKDDLREICNERIEIACKHGTCKDCVNNKGVCLKFLKTVKDDFYCKDFEKE